MPDTAPARLPGVPRWRRGGSMECVLTPQTDSAGQYVRSSQSGAQVCGSGWFCPLCALRTYCPVLFVCSRKHCISIDLPPPTRNTRQPGRGRVRHAPASPLAAGGGGEGESGYTLIMKKSPQTIVFLTERLRQSLCEA